ALYIDGQLSATNSGLGGWPGLNVRANDGMSLGANWLGQEQCRGSISSLETFNYPLEGSVISNDFDSDHDGLPDAWEQHYFGNLSQTASGDYDGDGISNYSEFINRM